MLFSIIIVEGAFIFDKCAIKKKTEKSITAFLSYS